MKLKKVFSKEKGTVVFRQVLRKGKWTIYVRESNGSESYELIRIRTTTKDITLPSGNVVLAGKELYPTNEQWGHHGWTYSTYEEAHKSFKLRSTREKKNRAKRK